MDLSKANGSINIPPFFGGGCEKYADWKIYMRIFLCSLDELLWTVIVTGYSDPEISDEKTSATTPKPRDKWSETEINLQKANHKALHCIFSALSDDERQSVNRCETAKEAWDLLEATYEGNTKVRAQKLEQLTYEFETIKMKEDESVDEFYRRIMKIANQCNSLKSKIPEYKLVRKLLRGLPKVYQSKVISIEDSYNLDTMRLDELLGDLKAFEQRWVTPEKKSKGVAFKATKKEKIIEDSEDLDIALITKKFKQFLKNKTNSGNRGQSESKKFNSRFDSSSNSKFESNRFKQKKTRTGPTCYECGGQGHISTECGNRKHEETQNKSMLTTWSDDEDATALVCSIGFTDLESDDSDFEEEMEYRCSHMYKASKAMLKKNKNLEAKLNKIKMKKTELEDQFEIAHKTWDGEREKLIKEVEKLQNLGSTTRKWVLGDEMKKTGRLFFFRRPRENLADEKKIVAQGKKIVA
ncbi:hypothetical protein ACLB2K_045654 [Fragaria x ananassa]